jgi:hypothetical protein
MKKYDGIAMSVIAAEWARRHVCDRSGMGTEAFKTLANEHKICFGSPDTCFVSPS